MWLPLQAASLADPHGLGVRAEPLVCGPGMLRISVASSVSPISELSPRGVDPPWACGREAEVGDPTRQ